MKTKRCKVLELNSLLNLDILWKGPEIRLFINKTIELYKVIYFVPFDRDKPPIVQNKAELLRIKFYNKNNICRLYMQTRGRHRERLVHRFPRKKDRLNIRLQKAATDHMIKIFKFC